MEQIKVTKGQIEGLYVIEPVIQVGNNGFFMEIYNQQAMAEAGLNMLFVQDTQSLSTKGVVRGLHFQKQHPQGQLIRVITGKVFYVVVDIREGSKYYGKWEGHILTDENKKQFYIPEGFAHGFMALSDVAEVCTKTSDFYYSEDQGGIAWNDPTIGIEWPELVGNYNGTASKDGYILSDGTALNISESDQNLPTLKDYL